MNPTGGPQKFPGLVPLFPAGKEPLPPGWTEEDREQLNQVKKWENMVTMGSESCAFKTVLAGGAGTLFLLHLPRPPLVESIVVPCRWEHRMRGRSISGY
jgi:hypothetical protein